MPPSLLDYQAYMDAANARAFEPIANGQQQQIAFIISQLNEQRRKEAQQEEVDARSRLVQQQLDAATQRDTRQNSFNQSADYRNQLFQKDRDFVNAAAAIELQNQDRLQREKLAELNNERAVALEKTRNKNNRKSEMRGNKREDNYREDIKTGALTQAKAMSSQLQELDNFIAKSNEVPLEQQQQLLSQSKALYEIAVKRGAVNFDGTLKGDFIATAYQLANDNRTDPKVKAQAEAFVQTARQSTYGALYPEEISNALRNRQDIFQYIQGLANVNPNVLEVVAPRFTPESTASKTPAFTGADLGLGDPTAPVSAPNGGGFSADQYLPGVNNTVSILANPVRSVIPDYESGEGVLPYLSRFPGAAADNAAALRDAAARRGREIYDSANEFFFGQ